MISNLFYHVHVQVFNDHNHVYVCARYYSYHSSVLAATASEGEIRFSHLIFSKFAAMGEARLQKRVIRIFRQILKSIHSEQCFLQIYIYTIHFFLQRQKMKDDDLKIIFYEQQKERLITINQSQSRFITIFFFTIVFYFSQQYCSRPISF